MMNGAVEGMDLGSGPPRSEERSWERAWTLDEMQKGASHWSLASDAGMLHYLQEFSHKMISRTHDIQEQMNGLVHEAKLTGVRLDNTVNDFIMLANTQFVENRVYEEDISEEEAGTQDGNKKKLEKTKEERSAALIPRIKDAMALGLQVLDAAFEKIDVNEANSESEDEDAAYVTEAILEPKDPYLSRPLPCLIGTPAFQQSDDIGLVEQPSDDDVSDHGSISESESAASSSEEEKLNGETGRDRHASVSSASSSSSEVESESSGDLFGGKVSDADEEKELKDEGETEVIDTHQTKADDFASELASRIRTSPPPMNKASKKKKRASNNDDLFAPPSLGIDEDEEDDSPFSHKTGLFSTGGGLFDDNQDEDGLIDEDAQTENKITAASLGQHTGSASDVGKREDLGKKESGKPKVKSPVQKPSPGGLFDNDQEDDDLFAALAPKKPPLKPSAEPTTSIKSKSGLFADEEEENDMFAVKEQKIASSKRKLPAGAVSMFGGAQNPLVAAIKAQKSPRSDTDEEQTWSDEGNQSSVSSASISTNSVTRNSQRKDHSPSASSNSLFAEEPEDLFSGFQGKRENVGKSGVTSGAALTSGSGGAGLFSDDEDLFGSSSKPQVAAPSAVRARKSGLLFDAEDDDDSDFLSGSEVNSSAISKKLPETGRSEVEDDLFGTTRKTQAPETKTTEVPSQSTVTTRKATLSLFDDDDDDNDLFGVTPTATKPGAMSRQKSMEPEKRASKSLFQGDDWLFGGADDNDPTVDLFGPKKPPKAKEIQDKAPPSVAPEGATTKSSSGGEVEERTLQEEETGHIPVKPKKLAGAVSMFGGMDPAMIGRTRSVSRPPVTEKPALQKKPEDNFIDQTDKQFTKSSSEGATIKPGASSIRAVKSEMEPPVGKSRTSPDIKTKQANLSLNPSALFPGASRPGKRVEARGTVEEAASFDEPVQTPMLHSVSKDRARVQVKRRPPSRKSRLTVDTESNWQDVPDATGLTDRAAGINSGHTPSTASPSTNDRGAGVDSGHTSSTASPPTNDGLFSPRKDKKFVTSKKAQKTDLVRDNPDNLLVVAEKVITGNSETLSDLSSGMDDASSDIVTDSSVTTSHSPVSKKTTEGLFGGNDIIHRQVSKVGQSERSNNDQQSLTTEVAARGSDSFDDELFPTSSRGGATKSTNKQTTDLFMDNDDVDEIFEVKKKTVIGSVPLPKDDIFGSGIMNTSTSQLTSKPISAVAPIVDDVIDDIFADTTANVKKGRKSADRDILHSKIPSDDEDDMFGAASRPSIRQPKKAVTRDEDIFADDTDIFADLPASKPKSKKTRAMTSTGPTKSLFSSSDVDDIFADVLSKPKPKVKKSLTPTKPSAVATPKGASIFDDDSPSIFDDPLNALGK